MGLVHPEYGCSRGCGGEQRVSPSSFAPLVLPSAAYEALDFQVCFMPFISCIPQLAYKRPTAKRPPN